MTSVSFTLAPENPSPKGFRIVLTDNTDQVWQPERSLVSMVNPYTEAGSVAYSYGQNEVIFQLPAGNYSYTVSAGPRWSRKFGRVEVGTAPIVIEFALRFVYGFPESGWAAGDSHMHPVDNKEPDRLAEMCAIEDVDFCGIQYWGSYTGRDVHVSPPQSGLYQAGRTWVSTDQEIEMHSPWNPWEDSTVMGLREKLPDLRGEYAYRMNAVFFREARARNADMIVYQAPVYAQFPVDVALGLVDSVNICDNVFSVMRSATGPWDFQSLHGDDVRLRKPEPFGSALWLFDHYYRILNAGFALPVSGGSAFPCGGGGGPIGMNRFYVETGDDPLPSGYYNGWKRGKTFATNGPLLLASINDLHPSITPLDVNKGKSHLRLSVASNFPVSRLEWVADGDVVAGKELTATISTKNIVWETDVDLRDHQWIVARCFGESERSLCPDPCVISPSFLVAHTSPFYLDRFPEVTPARTKAINRFMDHLNWMKEIVEGTRTLSFTTLPYADRELGDREKREIFSLLEETASVYDLHMKGKTNPTA